MFTVFKFLIVIFYFILLIICLRRIRKITKKTIYSYEIVSIMGVMIFIVGVIIKDCFTLYNIMTVYGMEDYNMYAFFTDIGTMFSNFTMYVFPLMILLAIFLLISNTVLIVVEGKSRTNVLGFLLGLSLIIGTLFVKDIYGFLGSLFDVHSYAGYCISLAIENVISITLTYFECMMIATTYIALRSSHRKIKHQKDYVVVLGCKVLDNGKPGGMLKKRVDAALKFARGEKTRFGALPALVFSGGQGYDEPISEAECMENYAVSQRFKGEMILEDESKTTRQNFLFLKKLVGSGENVAFATTDFHVFRSGVIATKNGYKNIEGIGAKSPWYYFNNSLIREYVANLSSEWKMHTFNLIYLNLASIIYIAICYAFDLM